ncbi:MAG: type II secretion system minor pseudopilin GspK, partial [Pseudomonadota bacterium]|nr:type II secretion system minor pseudopilin GspK [Pseudomonadota bacterium]
PVKVEDGSMQVAIEDEQGKFNLNNLIEGRPAGVKRGGQKQGDQKKKAAKKVWYQAYRNLLQMLELPEQLADVLVDWLDGDSKESGPDGAEDYYYEGLDTPYRAANQQLKSVGELQLLKGYSDEVVAKLQPLVTALPVDETDFRRINVNSSDIALLRALGSKKPLSADAVAALVDERTKEPFLKVQDFADSFHKSVSDPEVPLAQLVDVKSDYFSAHGCAAFGRVQFGIRSLLYRDPVKQNVKVLNRERFFTCPQIASKKGS